MMIYEVAAFDPSSQERHVWIIAAKDDADARSLVPKPDRALQAIRLAVATSRRHCVIGQLGALIAVHPTGAPSDLLRGLRTGAQALAARVGAALTKGWLVLSR